MIDHPEPDLDYVCEKCGCKFGELPDCDDDLCLCDTCFSDYEECEHCGHFFPSDELDIVNGKSVCECCAEELENEQSN